MENKNQNTGPRIYTLKDVAIIFAITIGIVLLFDSTGLDGWADRMAIGSTRDFYLLITQSLHTATSSIGLDLPRNSLKQSFVSISGIERDAGFVLAGSSDDLPGPVIESVQPSTHPGTEPSWINPYSTDPTPPTRVVTDEIFSPTNQLRILLLGDSMMADGFGTMIVRAVNEDRSLYPFRSYKHSTGLSRPDYYNWHAQADNLLDQDSYDAAIIMMGTNDSQNIQIDDVVYERNSPEWIEIYRSRIRMLLNRLLREVSKVYWVGMPPMRRGDFHDRMMILNEQYEGVCDEIEGAEYVSTIEIMSGPSGGYESYLTIDGSQVNVRHSDGMHLTRAGGALLADIIIDLIHDDFLFEENQESTE